MVLYPLAFQDKKLQIIRVFLFSKYTLQIKKTDVQKQYFNHAFLGKTPNFTDFKHTLTINLHI